MGILDWLAPVKSMKHPSTFKFSSRAKIITLWILAGLLTVFLAFYARLLPVFIWAAVAAYLLNPIVTFFSGKAKLPRALLIAILYIVLGVLLFWLAKLVFPLVTLEVSELTSGNFESHTFIGKIAAQGDMTLLGFTFNIREIVNALSEWIRSQIPSQALPFFFGALQRFIFLIVFFVITFYFLLEAEHYKDGFIRMIPEPYKEEMSSLIDRINMTLGAYIRAQVVLIIIMSLASFIVLSVLKVKYALVLSIMTGILEVIPVVGPVCATAIVTIVAIFQAVTPFGISNSLLAMLVIISYFLLRQLEDYFIIPNIAARFVKVHPVIGIFALLIGAGTGGVLGLFLAIPAAAILKVFLSYVYQKLVE